MPNFTVTLTDKEIKCVERVSGGTAADWVKAVIAQKQNTVHRTERESIMRKVEMGESITSAEKVVYDDMVLSVVVEVVEEEED